MVFKPGAAFGQKTVGQHFARPFDRKIRREVALVDIEGLSYKEIAEAMECPIGTVMSRLYRGRRQLHGLLYPAAVEHGLATPLPTPAANAEPVSLAAYRKRGHA